MPMRRRSAVERDELRREGLARLQARLAQAMRLKVEIAKLAHKTKRTGVRTDTEAEVISSLAFRLHKATYMIILLKQALIGL